MKQTCYSLLGNVHDTTNTSTLMSITLQIMNDKSLGNLHHTTDITIQIQIHELVQCMTIQIRRPSPPSLSPGNATRCNTLQHVDPHHAANRLVIHDLVMSVTLQIRRPSPRSLSPSNDSFVYFSESNRDSTVTLRVERLSPSLSHSLSLSLCLSLSSLSRARSLSLSGSHALSLSLSFSLSRSLSLFLSFSLSFSLSCSPALLLTSAFSNQKCQYLTSLLADTPSPIPKWIQKQTCVYTYTYGNLHI